MWDNAAALNRLAELLFAAAALMVLYAAVRFAIHQPVFALNQVRVVGAPGYVTLDQVEAIAFAAFARCTVLGLPANVPSVTGASRACILGAVYAV